MSHSSRIIGLSGTRGIGKDSFFTALQSVGAHHGLIRRAFADRLKQDLSPLIRSQFGFHPDKLTPAQKEILRHLYIGYGMAWRAADPLHWVKVVDQEISYMPLSFTPVITDIRFENEARYFREKYGAGFTLVGLTRDGAPTPTEEEQRSFPALQNLIDIHLKLPNVSGKDGADLLTTLQPVAAQLLSQLNLS